MATADNYGLFFDSVDGDRKYSSESFATWIRKFFTSGVFSGDLAVTANENNPMTVDVSGGYANVQGRVRFFEQPSGFTIAAASSTYPRIDNIVVRLDMNERQITLEYVKGDYSGYTATPKAPTRSNGIYELVIARVIVPASTIRITQNLIMDTRSDPDICGIVTGTVEEMDFSGFTEQFNSFKSDKQYDFDNWFENLQYVLDGDVAGHLQNQIDGLLLRAHPVGSYYWSDDPTDPSTLFGGVWESVHGRVLYAEDETHPAGTEGGKETVQLTTAEMPSHSHKVRYVGNSANGMYGGQPGTSVNRDPDYNYYILEKEGGDQPHENMMPYHATYVWRRTA